MSLTYAIVVNGPAYGNQTSRSAYQFASALIAEGHVLQRVFFYQDGVLNGSALTAPASDEFELVAAWQTLAKTHNVELQTCVAAALRRGIVSEQEAEQNQLPAANLADGFEQSGLGGLAEVMLTADRVIQF
ncbi:sulfurtransferase complex subunit TusD [Photobacterium angustum]|uniref:Sulfurtransferase TusD homolog n=1 Tax=Photobacterium angustum TaxID=661 RepID=A0A855SA86_PHOAN|nr:sulfurtransferase complex subunit TusD [Photobacterium angustum]KJF81374.1 sulfur transfer complex subunit TusD [Photobacterium damselae subsp. damselae]KJG40062.1 sulfur transfer complex subunit TusD [Photobacterium angustum]KJG44936.1 sulfur transfer complex subunit TusD [Photobacterium angustum]KJG48278.1 sulfur transfer complex subunit TusD [Photobacterium angustum]KJG52277.1 sulfur transfer complex subunit TusD [Photobacterium angustum]